MALSTLPVAETAKAMEFEGRGGASRGNVRTRRSPGKTVETSVAVTERKHKLPLRVRVLMISLFIPWIIPVGSLIMSPYRFVLLFTLIPSLVAWASGKAGRIRLPDITILAYALWSIIALSVVHGTAVGIQSGGVQSVETLGAYFMARCYIRTAEDFRLVCGLLFKIILALLPFALFEWVTGRNMALELFSLVTRTHGVYRMPGRLGLERVQSVFEHPILFGVCCSSAFALTFAVIGWEKSFVRRWGGTFLIGLATLTSLSSGPISAMLGQIFLLFWGWSLRSISARWKILIGLIWLGIGIIEVFAKRPLPNVLLSSFALDLDSAYYRVLIWYFGSQSALNHPFFGVGFGMWDHPSWMTQSIDMFWLYPAIIYGIPAAVFMMGTFLSIAILVGMVRDLDPRHYSYRMGYLICMSGFFLAGWTVHFWNATYALFIFLMASGVWIMDVKSEAEAQNEKKPTRRERAISPREGRAGVSRSTPT